MRSHGTSDYGVCPGLHDWSVEYFAVGLLVAAFLIVALTGSASASGSYYVDSVNGNDGNAGTQSAPWRSLSRVNSQLLAPGDSLFLKRGSSWSGQTLLVPENGTAINRITVDAYASGAAPLISGVSSCAYVSGDYVTVRNLTLDDCRWAGIEFAAGATFGLAELNTVSHNAAGVHVATGSSDNTIQKNTIVNNNKMSVLTPCPPSCSDDSGAFGILLNGNRNKVANNTISGSDTFSYDFGRDGAAVELYNASANTIQRNVAIDNETFSELGGASTTDNAFIYNSVRSATLQAKFVVLPGAALNTTLRNNSAYLTNATSQGFVCYSGCSPTVLHMRNNLVKAVLKAGYADGAFDDGYGIYKGPAQFSLGPSSTLADPRFHSPTDLHLEPTSPAIDSGLLLGYSTDVEGNPVPSDKPDRGAYEAPAAQTPSCPDFNADGYVDSTDITSLAAWFGRPVPPAPAQYDIAPDPPDGFVDGTDISRVTGLFGQHCP